MISMLLAAALSTLPQTPAAPAGYALTWSDEFSGDGLPDASKWRYDTQANKTGWYNEELQYYSAARPENARIEDGVLIIEARREILDPPPADWGGQAYTSARMISTAAWSRGFIETRAKIPCGRGSWPAIWMLPEKAAGWPIGGEIDIMEHVGHRPGVVHGSIHTEAYNHVKGTQSTATRQVADACDAFHRYQVRWTPDEIVFLIDDQPFHRFTNDQARDVETWPFDKPFHLILNVAVGGTWGGEEGVDDAVFPQRMEVDYVRVYQPAD
ncbi:hypothetical protein GCM10017620_13290 [Brevundimonas intermedia]|uniref:GH16 domain-containing protein n=1 Tax=Brevundimonas intermedia TaxID=74315 RepID=A0ABQ5T972_9CAUL|nr:glycoside hydrolase family 16 protein [Brevundimonas intermedia]GLK48356.1 hypothetical protein GCM10017620_13290 [Brevundimonas intermedia]